MYTKTVIEKLKKYGGFFTENHLKAVVCALNEIEYEIKQTEVNDCVIPDVSKVVCPECGNQYPHISKQGTLSCEDCGYNSAN